MSASPQLENGLPTGGWIKLYRASIEKGWLTNHKLWAFWSYCLLKASHKEYVQVVGNQQVHLLPGQFIFGRATAARDLKMSEQNIRSVLGTLKTLKNLTNKSTNKFSVITVVNWASYQGDANESTSKATDGQPASNHKQEVKKERKKKDAPSPEVKAAIDYFFQAVESAKGFKPKIATKDAALVKANLKNLSLDRIKAQIDFFLSNGKSKEHISIAAALSADTYNLFEAKKVEVQKPLGGLAY